MRILIAVDLTDDDAEAFVAHAVKWVAPLGATLTLAFVDEAADEHPYVLDNVLRAAMSTQYDEWHAQMRDRLAALRDTLPAAQRGEAMVVRGRAAPELLSLLEDHDAIVLGNRPATGLSRLAHGVVAERVSRQSDKPAIILPRDDDG